MIRRDYVCKALSVLLGAALIAHAVHAESPESNGTGASVAAAPQVLAAERLYSAWMEGQLAYRNLPGVVVAVVHDQEPVWVRGFGYADVNSRRPMTAATKFRIASNSKLFTAIAIMQLREQGKLRLDDPVSQYLPWFHAHPAGGDDGVITVEQLLAHSSGLPREAGDHWVTNRFPSRDELKRRYADRDATFPPAVRWKYSNLAFAVAGMLIEQVSGQPWATYVKGHIFDPLGMAGSSVDAEDPGLAVGYGRRMPDGSRAIAPFIDSQGLAAATGVTSDAEDLVRFLSAQLRRGSAGGGQILNSGSWRELLRVRSVEDGWNWGTGLGFDVERVKGKTLVGHEGAYAGYSTQTFVRVDDRVGVVVLTNATDGDANRLAIQLMGSVGEAVVRAASGRADSPSGPWDPAWERYAGLYRSPWEDRQVVVLDRSLAVIDPSARSLDVVDTLEPVGNDRFRYRSEDGYDAIGELVRFIAEPGKPMRMVIGDSWSDRISP